MKSGNAGTVRIGVVIVTITATRRRTRRRIIVTESDIIRRPNGKETADVIIRPIRRPLVIVKRTVTPHRIQVLKAIELADLPVAAEVLLGTRARLSALDLGIPAGQEEKACDGEYPPLS